MGRFRGCEPEPHKIQLGCPGLELDQGVLQHTPLLSRYQLEKYGSMKKVVDGC
jgi:hypothetical protein